MLYNPYSGLSDGNISGNFPFARSVAQQPSTDFTFFEDSGPHQQVYGQTIVTGQSQEVFVNYYSASFDKAFEAMKAQLEIGIIWELPVSLRHWQHRLTSTAHFF
jgi:hypothetical protein